jgi:hypothetical protein
MYIENLIYAHRHLAICALACCFLQIMCVHLHRAYMYICVLVPAEYLCTFAHMCVPAEYVCTFAHVCLYVCSFAYMYICILIPAEYVAKAFPKGEDYVYRNVRLGRHRPRCL